MSTPNPTRVIDDVIRNDLHAPIPIPSSLIATHVVSKLTDAGYSIVPNGAAPKRHRGIEPDTEMGGVACSECGWHLSGRTVDNDTQERHHREHSAAAEEEKP